jgi:DNA-binding transcriptional MerR regulator
MTTPTPHPTFNIDELAAEAGVTRRTVYYYVSQGLLPGSGMEGRGSRYTVGHLNRLRLIRELQREHLPLAEIRQRLERLNDDQVGDLLSSDETLPEAGGSAFDYIQSLLAGTNRRGLTLPQPPSSAAGRSTSRVDAATPSLTLNEPPIPASPNAAATRSQWERISLAPDVELHVRRPLSRFQNRAVERFLAEARRIFEEDPS